MAETPTTNSLNSLNCIVHWGLPDLEAKRIRSNVCVHDHPLKKHSDGHNYCFFHLPDSKKSFEDFSTRIFKRIENKNAFFNYVYFPPFFVFQDVKFDSPVNFKSHFSGDVIFERCEFKSSATFTQAFFAENARFYNVRFHKDALFNQVRFEGHITFERSLFHDVRFSEALFKEDLNFTKNKVGKVIFDFSKFTKRALFLDTIFNADELDEELERAEATNGHLLTFVDKASVNFKYIVIDENQFLNSADKLALNKNFQFTVRNLEKNYETSFPSVILKNIKHGHELIDYYKKTLRDSRQLNEANILVFGQEGAGKTSLIKRLIEDEFDPNETSTEFSIKKDWKPKIDGREIQLNVWDFGGREIMHHIHQSFLTKRSLYILVLDSRLDADENRVDYWLEKIKILGGDSPVIIVGNKSDQHPLRINQKGLIDEYPNIKGFYPTSCLDEDGLYELESAMFSEIGSLQGVSDTLPGSWFNVKNRLENIEGDYISLDDYYEICEQEGVLEKADQNILIQLLRDLAIVLNFADDQLQDTNVLNPDWVIKGIYRIINTKEKFETPGELTREMVGKILDPGKYPSTKQMFVLDMMQKFELCFEIDKDKKYLIPDLLDEAEVTGENDWQDSLKFEYRYKTYFESIFTRLMVRRHTDIIENLYWKTGVVFKYEVKNEIKNRALVKARNNNISIFVDGNLNTRRNFLTIIRRTLDEINQQTFREFKDENVGEKIPIDGRPGIVVDFQHLLTLNELGEKFVVPEGLREKFVVKELLEGIDSFGKKDLAVYIKTLETEIKETEKKIEEIDQIAKQKGQLHVLPHFVIFPLLIIGLVTYTAIAGFSFYFFVFTLIIFLISLTISFYRGINWNFAKAIEKAIADKKTKLLEESGIDLAFHYYQKNKLSESKRQLKSLTG